MEFRPFATHAAQTKESVFAPGFLQRHKSLSYVMLRPPCLEVPRFLTHAGLARWNPLNRLLTFNCRVLTHSYNSHIVSGDEKRIELLELRMHMNIPLDSASTLANLGCLQSSCDLTPAPAKEKAN